MVSRIPKQSGMDRFFWDWNDQQTQRTICDEPVAIMKDLGLNWTHWMQSVALSVVNVVSFSPLVVCQTWTRPSVEPRGTIRAGGWSIVRHEPQKTYFESGLNEASRGAPREFWWPWLTRGRAMNGPCLLKIGRVTVKVWRRTPLKASTRRINDVFVETSIIFPLGLNFRCVHWKSPSHSYFNISKGPWIERCVAETWRSACQTFSWLRISYRPIIWESIPTPKASPSGS